MSCNAHPSNGMRVSGSAAPCGCASLIAMAGIKATRSCRAVVLRFLLLCPYISSPAAAASHGKTLESSMGLGSWSTLRTLGL